MANGNGNGHPHSNGLSPRQKAFVREYLIDLNATKAAIRAGYSEAGASVRGAQLLADIRIQHLIAEAREKHARNLDLSAERVLREYARIAFANTTDVVNIVDGQAVAVNTKELPEDKQAAIAEIAQTASGGIRVKMHSKTAALDSLAKHLGLLVDKVEHSGGIDLRQMLLDATANLEGDGA